jgi:hypothetical protein
MVIVAAPRLAVPDSLQAGTQARQLAADLRLAQRLAIGQRAVFVLEFSPATPPYLTYSVHQQGGSAQPDYPKTIAAGVTVSGPQQFTFQPDGSTTTGGTITLGAGSATATVQVVTPTGRVTMAGP